MVRAEQSGKVEQAEISDVTVWTHQVWLVLGQAQTAVGRECAPTVARRLLTQV